MKNWLGVEQMVRPHGIRDRDWEVIVCHFYNESIATIAERFGISTEKVQEIIERYPDRVGKGYAEPRRHE